MASASTSRIASSLSNAGGSTGSKGLSRSNPRANSTIKEGNSPAALKTGGVRRNGQMVGSAQTDADSTGGDDFKGPYKGTNQDWRPSKTAGPR